MMVLRKSLNASLTSGTFYSTKADKITWVKEKILTFEDRHQFLQCCVTRIREPRLNKDTVIGLQLEVLRYVIHNDYPFQVSPDP